MKADERKHLPNYLKYEGFVYDMDDDGGLTEEEWEEVLDTPGDNISQKLYNWRRENGTSLDNVIGGKAAAAAFIYVPFSTFVSHLLLLFITVVISAAVVAYMLSDAYLYVFRKLFTGVYPDAGVFDVFLFLVPLCAVLNVFPFFLISPIYPFMFIWKKLTAKYYK